MQKPLVIYHADCADGFAAAFATWLKLGDDAEYVAMQHGQGRTPFEFDIKYRDVYVLDFSFPRETMDRLFEHAKRVVWLDHHKTSFESYGVPVERINDEVELEVGLHHRVILDNNKCGALLAWEHFNPGVEPPTMFRFIDDQDRWQNKLDDSREFVAALWSHAPWSFFQWKEAFLPADMGKPGLTFAQTARYSDLMKEGRAVVRAIDQVSTEVAARAIEFRLPIKTEEFGCTSEPGLFVNSGVYQSEIGNLLAERSGTFGMVWNVEETGRVKCSLRSIGDYDVSHIAQHYGGGGHRNAAAFRTELSTLMSWLESSPESHDKQRSPRA